MVLSISLRATQSFVAPGLWTWATKTETNLPATAELYPGITHEREKQHFQLVFGNEQWLSSTGTSLVAGTSRVAQWLRIRLPMQGTRVRALVREDPTCRGAAKPVRHNC